MSRYSKWAKTEYGFGVRLAATLLAGVVFVLLLPHLLIVVCPALDRRLGLAGFNLGAPSTLLGGILMAAGLFFALWSIVVQLTRGRGTPLPMMPTQGLLIVGPFRYCRNPMALGSILAYGGLSIGVGTVVGAALTLALAALLIAYIKRVEERELAERFGQVYLDYKRQTPFMIPRVRAGR